MKEQNEKIPDPKELEKEIGEFLTKKFGNNVKLVSPVVLPEEETPDKGKPAPEAKKTIRFDLKPAELVRYLDQYIVKQESAKSILATKICTHFNRIRRYQDTPDILNGMVGTIKNNVMMIGPTGVGKTYMIKLIAKKIGVPFIKGDATKFSETGYVGGDVEDLVRDLVREADGDIELAQYGIIYIDEIDKIASAHNLIGADVSRTGVQRALLKPMEETDVELKVPHDPISMIQEIERFRRSGKREKSSINTKNILFIMSGAFGDLDKIIKKRMTEHPIGFGAQITHPKKHHEILKQVKSEDLIAYGFESEFVGRLPVRAIFEELNQEDLFGILRNPNNPIVLGKKMDFAAYGIDVKFSDDALQELACIAHQENTGARGLVSAIEGALLLFENHLPSTKIYKFPVTAAVIHEPEKKLEALLNEDERQSWDSSFEEIFRNEKEWVQQYVKQNTPHLNEKYRINLSDRRIDIVADYYCRNITDVGNAIRQVKAHYDEVKKIELYFYKQQDVNIVLEDEAIDFIIERFVNSSETFEQFYKQIVSDFEYGLKLVRDKTGRNRFFITKAALENPDTFIGNLLKEPARLTAGTDNGREA